jgi:hypothetical protein
LLKIGDAAVVAAEEREKVFGEILLIELAQAADDAEVDRGIARILGIRDIDEYVAGVHVGVEKIVAEYLREKDIDAVFRKPPNVRAACLEAGNIADRNPVNALHREHVRPRVIPIDFGHVELR